MADRLPEVRFLRCIGRGQNYSLKQLYALIEWQIAKIARNAKIAMIEKLKTHTDYEAEASPVADEDRIILQ